MKIALVDVNFGASSTGKIVSDLVAGLRAGGHSAVAFYGRGEAGGGAANKISTRGEVAAHVLATRLTGLTDGFSPFATRRLIEQLERFKPDVVHLHDLHGYFVNIAELCDYLKHRRIPTVWTFHSDFMYTGRCGSALECEQWKTGCRRCPDLGRYPKTWFFDFAGRMFRRKQALFANFDRLRLTAPSSWLAARMSESMVRGKPIDVVYNGLNTLVFHPCNTDSLSVSLGLSGKFCVLTVGSGLFSPNKGGQWVLELARRNPHADLSFLMIGVDQLPPSIPDNVKIFPRIKDQDLLAQYYSLADVFLLPSQMESFSMVCAESLACGTPVIGFEAGAPKEVAPEGYGRFVPYGDLDALEALLLGIQEKKTVLRCRDDCIEFATANYSLQSMVKSYETIYQEAIRQ